MAAVTASTIADALAQEYPELASTIFRHFLLAQIIPVKPGSGKNDSFDVRFRSTQAARNATDGQDVADYIADTFVPATGIWSEYDAAVKVTGLSMAVAASSNGTPADVKDQFGSALDAAYEELAVLLRTDAYAGVSTSPQGLIGLYGGTTVGALGSTGTYYNINRGGAAPLPNWAGNVLRNGGVKRKLMPKHIDQALTAVVDARGTIPKRRDDQRERFGHGHGTQAPDDAISAGTCWSMNGMVRLSPEATLTGSDRVKLAPAELPTVSAAPAAPW